MLKPGDRFETKPRHWVEITEVDSERQEVRFTYCSMPMWGRTPILEAMLGISNGI